ncbi:uncharacterized protein LOC129356701 [Poeciliopsis prolifica]|uniref:uncharacterized protein LOC129356701 n=1 Tax=Poeciliopsis prolifica TaxID=188132 RepID=UPI0024142EAF|nr:uncharacterized protein LOC129356701 [Poeciliopsis prolifica]
MGMSVFCVPVHKLMLHSKLFEGEVRMGVRPALPVVGVTVILGNHIAGGKVWPDKPESPVIVSVPLVSSGPDENEKSHPEVFQACAVTRAMKASSDDHQDENFGKDTQTSSFCWSNIPLSISQSDLGQEQRSDPTIQHLFQSALPAEEMQNHAHGYFVENEVLKQLHIQHNQSTAYHAQSQGALERFHQTLKSLLRAYCVQMKADWEDGLPWLLLAAREVTQESTGFSPNELVFGHTVRGPLTVLRDEWKDAEPPQNLLHYVNGFKQRLFTATQMANKNLSSAQEKMKCLYDKKAEHRVFLSGDQVLALLPVVTSPFQAKFSGPHTVLKRLSDQNYLIATPERRKKQQTVHLVFSPGTTHNFV